MSRLLHALAIVLAVTACAPDGGRDALGSGDAQDSASGDAQSDTGDGAQDETRDDAGSDGYPTPRRAAEEALAVVAALADSAEALEHLGFETGDRMTGTHVTLGRALPIVHVDVDELKTHDPSEPPDDLIDEPSYMLFPISVDGDLRSSALVAKVGDGWLLRSIGQSHLTRTLVEIERGLGGGGEDLFVLNVPAMYQMLVAFYGDDGLMLAPVYDDADKGFRQGQAIPAETAIRVLHATATDFRPALLADADDGG